MKLHALEIDGIGPFDDVMFEIPPRLRFTPDEPGDLVEALHPAAQARLYPALRSLLPNACIFATTTSPAVAASVPGALVFSLRPDGDGGRVWGRQGHVRVPL